MKKPVETELARVYIGEWCRHEVARLKLIDYSFFEIDQRILARCPDCIDASVEHIPAQFFNPTGMFIDLSFLDKPLLKTRPRLTLIQGGKSKHPK